MAKAKKGDTIRKETVLVEFDNGVAWVTMNRPEKRNAMSPTLNREMLEVVDLLEEDDRCKILTLTDAGWALYGKLTPHVTVISEYLFDPLTDDEARSLSGLIDVLTRRLDSLDPNSSQLIDTDALARDDVAPFSLGEKEGPVAKRWEDEGLGRRR